MVPLFVKELPPCLHLPLSMRKARLFLESQLTEFYLLVEAANPNSTDYKRIYLNTNVLAAHALQAPDSPLADLILGAIEEICAEHNYTIDEIPLVRGFSNLHEALIGVYVPLDLVLPRTNITCLIEVVFS